MAFSNDGSVINESKLGAKWSSRNVAYGDQWEPTALELFECVGSLSVSSEPASLEKRGGDQDRGATGPPALPSKLDIGFGPGSGSLPLQGSLRWHVLAASDDTMLHAIVENTVFESFVTLGNFALGARDAETYVLKLADPENPGPELEIDLRLHPLKMDGTVRLRHFGQGAKLLTESASDSWPILGPRTVRWCLRFLAQQDQHPRARHTKWVHECRLEPWDEGVQDHDLAMRMFELGLAYDQCNLSELSAFELLARRAQMAEWRHRDRILGRGDELFDDQFLYMGTGETRGLLMVSPELQNNNNNDNNNNNNNRISCTYV